MYPINGTKTGEYISQETDTHRNKAFVITTALMSIAFLVFAVLMFILYKKEMANDNADDLIRQSIVDLDGADVYDNAHQSQRLVD